MIAKKMARTSQWTTAQMIDLRVASLLSERAYTAKYQIVCITLLNNDTLYVTLFQVN